MRDQSAIWSSGDSRNGALALVFVEFPAVAAVSVSFDAVAGEVQRLSRFPPRRERQARKRHVGITTRLAALA